MYDLFDALVNGHPVRILYPVESLAEDFKVLSITGTNEPGVVTCTLLRVSDNHVLGVRIDLNASALEILP